MPNWEGAGSGAISGAVAGSTFGPWGTAIGGVSGGIAGLFSGNKDKLRQIGIQTPEQEQRLRSILEETMSGQTGRNFGQANDYISQILSGSPEAFDRFAAPYRTEFEQQTIPRLSEKFAGLGGAFGQGETSSGFGQAIGGAATQFHSNLANIYAQLQQQAAHSAFGQYNSLSGLGLSTQAFQPAYQPGNLGFGGNAAAGLSQGIGTGIGQGLGTNLSSRFAEMFKPKTPAAPAAPTP